MWVEIVEKFLRRLYAAGSSPEFISLYVYPYDTRLADGFFQPSRSSDRDFTLHCVDERRRALSALPAASRDVKLYVTEWNMTLSQRNWMNDSCYRGAWILRNAIRLWGKADALTCFTLSDQGPEFYDTNACLFGGIGLVSRDGVIKPAGFALDFLNRLYKRYVAKGENYLVSTDGRGNYGIVCHNMKDLNHLYYLESENALDKAHRFKYYEDMEPFTLRLTLADAEAGEYRLKTYRVNNLNGSVLHAWHEMGYETNLSRNDIRYLRNTSEPKLSIRTVTVQGGKLPVELVMRPNEIAYLHLEKKV